MTEYTSCPPRQIRSTECCLKLGRLLFEGSCKYKERKCMKLCCPLSTARLFSLEYEQMKIFLPLNYILHLQVKVELNLISGYPEILLL